MRQLIKSVCLLAGFFALATPSLLAETKEELRAIYSQALRNEGYNPEPDSDGDIMFKYEGSTYFIIIHEKSASPYVAIIYPNFWSIESKSEHAKAAKAMIEVTREIRVAKVYFKSDESDVNASAEFYLASHQDFGKVFMRNLASLRAVVNTFREKMKA